MADNRFGVYFLGDDVVYDWAVGLLRSLKVAAPDLEVICIPFSERIDRMARLVKSHGYSIADDPLLGEMDKIGRSITECMVPPPRRQLANMFRKFYAFWGPFDQFLLCDSDIVVLEGFKELFDLQVVSDPPIFSYAHFDVEQTYKPGPLRDRMLRDYGSHSINAGFWASRKGVFTLQQVQDLAAEAKLVASDFCATIDQPFVNYCLDVCQVARKQFDARVECAWAGDRRPLKTKSLPDGRLEARWPSGALVPAIHWAGYPLGARTPHYHIQRHFRVVGMPLGEQLRLMKRELLQKASGSSMGRALRWVKRRLRGA